MFCGLLLLQIMEIHRNAKQILHPVMPSNSEGPVSHSLTTVITKGRHKTDSTKRDKSHWEHI